MWPDTILPSLTRRKRRTPPPWLPKLAWAWLCAGLFLVLPVSAEELQIDLNRADVSELCRLPGIGPKRAEAIVELRRKKPFTRISQLLQVRGIGRKTLSRLRPLLYIDEVGQIQKAALHPLRQQPAAPAPTGQGNRLGRSEGNRLLAPADPG